MLINFFGTVPTLLLGDKIDKVYEVILEYYEKLGQGEILDISEHLFDMMLVTTYLSIYNAFIIGGVVLFIILLKKKKFRLHNVCEFKLPRERRFATVVANPGVIIFIVFTILTTIVTLVSPLIATK